MKTLKIVSWHPLIIFFLGLVFPFASAQAFDLSGTWSGVYHNPDFGYQRASAILTHAANDVSGTYSTSTGVSGNIRLIVTGTTLEGTLVQEGSCSGYFLVTGVVRGEVLTVMINGYDCSPAATNIVLLTQNEVFFEPWIVLNKVRYSDGYEEGDFWTGLNAPNPLDIQAVSVVTPNFDEFALSMDDEDNRWERTVMGFPANENPRHFPDGFYYYNIQYKDGSTATAFSVLDTEYPDHFPIIISPAHGDIIDPGSDLLVAWEPADASVDSIYASAGDQPGQGYPSSDTQFIVPGGSLGVRMEHDVWLSFQKNSPYFPCNKSLTSSIDFFTGSLLVGSWIAYGKGKSPSNETAIFFFAGLESAGVTAAAISTPPGESIPFSYDPVFRDWRVDQGLASEEEAQVRFPDGDYQFQVTFENGSTETKTVRLSGLLPEAIPNITQPQNGATVDKFEPTLNIAWDPWPNGSGEVYLEIVKIDAIPDDNGFESKVKELVWQGAFTPEATVCTVPLFSMPTVTLNCLSFLQVPWKRPPPRQPEGTFSSKPTAALRSATRTWRLTPQPAWIRSL